MIRLPVLDGRGGGGGGRSAPGGPSSQADALREALLAANCGEVRFGEHDRLLYATDASNYQVAPIGVVIPGSVEEAARAVGVCAARGAAILPRGGGTSLAGQCTNEAVVIDFSAQVRRVVSVDAQRRRCAVEPGITVEELNDVLRPSGLMFAPDPATARHANIGGCIGNNAAGARSIRYGRTSENLIGVEALLADGRRAWLREGAAAEPRAPEWLRDLTRQVVEIVEPLAEEIRTRYPKTVRRNAGYNLDLILDQIERARREGRDPLETVNLAHLVCGSEGTLAVTLGAELALVPLPRRKGLATLGFASLEAAIEAVAPLLATGPVAVELLDDVVLGVASANIEYRRYVELMPQVAGLPPRAVLYVEYFSELDGEPGDREIAERLEAMRQIAGPASLKLHTDAQEMAQVWKLRKAGEPLLHGMAQDRKPITFVEDNAVPVENLVEFVRRFKQIVARHSTTAAYWAHASVGVLHVRPALDLRDPGDEQRMRDIAVEVADLARELGGVMSGEHGDGRVRSPLLERFYGPRIVEAFRQIKRLFDPAGLMNPGNIVGAGPIESLTQRTRVRPAPGGPLVDVLPVETYYDYSDQHGLRGAVEMCNGAGVCRKKSGGVMCPSYMGTLDERHSTRGRGNALRLAVTGQLPGGSGEAAGQRTADRRPSPWNDPETLATLDLCLSCKACKAECPSNVDIARLKAEYLAQGHRERGGAPLGARLVAGVRTLNRLGAMTPRFSNWVAGTGLARSALRRVIGLDPRRSLPPLRRSLARQWGRETPAGADDRWPTVALLADCFTMYNEPHIGLAARRLLQAFGYRVRLIDAGCCARPAISSGALDLAVGMIDTTARRLAEELAPDEPLLVLEPSCLSAIRDDWLLLKVPAPRAMRDEIAGRSRLVEQFLDERWDQHPRRPGFSPGDQQVTLHAHCHQKVLWSADSSAKLMKRVLGERLLVPDTTCCGMAGAFGYSHYDLSMKIGELSVFPAARSAQVMCATGTSCRHQIHDGAQVEAQHPVQWLAGRVQA